jgi:hypothetical protein
MGRRGDGRNDDWRRRREREEESERELESKQARSRGVEHPGRHGIETQSSDPKQKLIELMDRSGPMMEQLNNLYAMYLSGVERRPPIERRQVLDALMQQISGLPRPTPALQFRVQTVLASYTAHKDRWDKLMRERENGRR